MDITIIEKVQVRATKIPTFIIGYEASLKKLGMNRLEHRGFNSDV